ncbi:MAG: succinylglutamate desuccinylase/aspartoacylase family protein [Halapricum sp.]
MRIEQLGDGEPDVAVVAAIHGDEPCGVKAIERLLKGDPDVDRPVRLIVANEEALAADRRYLDEDLNRAFPGDPGGVTHEDRLAADLTTAIEGCTTLALHSTQSYERPFAIVQEASGTPLELAQHLSVDAVVETGPFDQGRLFEVVDRLVEVECGFQGSDSAADNATGLVREFLRATGVLSDEPPLEPRDHPVFRLNDVVPKSEADEYEVFVRNFERVEAGDAFAAVDGERIVAEESFYPVLLSAYGYEDVFGYAAEKVDVST